MAKNPYKSPRCMGETAIDKCQGQPSPPADRYREAEEMRLYYQLTALLIIVLLIVATVLLLSGRKKRGDWWLAGFLASLISNTAWVIAEPILSGIGGLSAQVEIGNLATRLVCVAGYCALLVSVIVRRRSSPTEIDDGILQEKA